MGRGDRIMGLRRWGGGKGETQGLSREVNVRNKTPPKTPPKTPKNPQKPPKTRKNPQKPGKTPVQINPPENSLCRPFLFYRIYSRGVKYG